jgi:hypothetical protein
MATTVGQHSVAAFTSPSNGDALDATVVKGNDNTLRSAYVDHDADSGIHIQSSDLASRPAAGTAGRKWITTDVGDVRFWYDNGSTWEEVATATTLPQLTVTGNTTLGDATSDTITMNGRVASSIVPSSNNTRDLGSSANRFKDIYSAGTIYPNIISGATLNNTTFTGTITGINANPTTYSSVLTSNLSPSYNTETTVLTLNVPVAGTYLGVGQVYFQASSTIAGQGTGGIVKILNPSSTLIAYSVVSAAVITSSSPNTYATDFTVPIVFIATVSTPGTYTMRAIVNGNTGLTPATIAGSSSISYTTLTMTRIN